MAASFVAALFMNIIFKDSQKHLQVTEDSLENVVVSTLDLLKVHTNEIAIYFVTPKKITQIHAEYFNDPSPTDCISFPMDAPSDENNDEFTVLGEIFVCPKVALEFARQNNLNAYLELTLYIIHGILHLVGYDDLNEEDRNLMRQSEKKCMNHLQSKNIHLLPKTTK